MSIHTQTQHPSTAAKKGHCYTKNFFKEGADASVQDRKRATGLHMEDNEYLLDDDKESECLLNDDKEALMQQSEKKSAENARALKNEKGCKLCRKSFATVAEVKESLNPDSFVDDKYELLNDNNENNNETADRTSLCLVTTCPNTDDVTSPQESGTNKLRTDNRTIFEEQLRAEVCEDNRLSTEQQEDLYNVLAKYLQQLSKRPGKWTKFVYEFEIEGSMPHNVNSRPTPFALRNQVREQIHKMLKYGTLEESQSACINPTTLVIREGKLVHVF